MPFSPEQQARAESFLAFFLCWADRMGWNVPDIHIRTCIWLAVKGPVAVLRCFRGFGKSTLLAVYNAWRYKENQGLRILHQGDQDGTAYKTSRDTKRVLSKHPMTRHLVLRGESSFWWVPGNDDERNPSMQAAGIMSNITSSRADEVQNDDVEVPRNIRTPEARETLRYRLGEQTHILVPGGTKLYVGTPHTHDSLYDEVEKMGADCLTIRMFEREFRIEQAAAAFYSVPFRPAFVFSGIGKNARLLAEDVDYRWTGKGIEFSASPGTLIDCYSDSAWPERFTRAEMEKRRRETRTINEWDSQYQLHSKPIAQIRLDPARIIPYDVEPVIRYANRTASMYLGSVKIAGMAARWDPSSGKIRSDVSALALVLQDEQGRRYLHRSIAITGDVAEFSEDGKRITGGQVWQICDLVEQFSIPRVTIETNGIGGFAPAVLKAALKQRKLICGVSEEHAVANKNKRILEAYEGPMSSGMMWGHVSVLDGEFWDQMKDFNPETQNQADDLIDSGAGAITDTPERINVRVIEADMAPQRHEWRANSGVHEVAFER
jgi:hypothetical protein